MKRSSTLTLTSLMAGASLTVTACDQPAAQWGDSSVAQKDPVPAVAYRSVAECVAAGEVSGDECRKAEQAAIKDDAASAPRYDAQKTCEEVHGAGNCVPRSQANGGSFFTPLLTGFVIGRMLDGAGSPYYRGTGLYRRDERYGGGYGTGWGGVLSRDYSTGRTTIDRSRIDPPDAVRQAPPRVQTRTAVVSRGGFGGGGRGFGG